MPLINDSTSAKYRPSSYHRLAAAPHTVLEVSESFRHSFDIVGLCDTRFSASESCDIWSPFATSMVTISYHFWGHFDFFPRHSAFALRRLLLEMHNFRSLLGFKTTF